MELIEYISILGIMFAGYFIGRIIESWLIGSWNEYFIGKQLRKKSLNIWCEKCKSKHKAYLK